MLDHTGEGKVITRVQWERGRQESQTEKRRYDDESRNWGTIARAAEHRQSLETGKGS